MKGRFMRRGAAGEGVPGEAPAREAEKGMAFLFWPPRLLRPVFFPRQLVHGIAKIISVGSQKLEVGQ